MPTRSRRRRWDDADYVPLAQPDYSTYHHPETMRGPCPPSWVITSPAAVDVDHGVLKTGKEADVSLLERAHGDQTVWLAAKRYRPPEHRLFHRDAGYLEGRRVRDTREARAMATRTAFGRRLIAGRWAMAEFDVLGRAWTAGASVPYPVQLLGDELLLEFVGDARGTAAPRLAQLRPAAGEAAELFVQLRRTLLVLAEAGYTHGDLSPYNVLVDDGRVVVIDLPQAVDLVANPQGLAYLRRDCEHICAWFAARGVAADAGALELELRSAAPG